MNLLTSGFVHIPWAALRESVNMRSVVHITSLGSPYFQFRLFQLVQESQSVAPTHTCMHAPLKNESRLTCA